MGRALVACEVSPHGAQHSMRVGRPCALLGARYTSGGRTTISVFPSFVAFSRPCFYSLVCNPALPLFSPHGALNSVDGRRLVALRVSCRGVIKTVGSNERFDIHIHREVVSIEPSAELVNHELTATSDAQ